MTNGQDNKQGLKDSLAESAKHLELTVARLGTLFANLTGEDRPTESECPTRGTDITESARRLRCANAQALEWLDEIERVL